MTTARRAISCGSCGFPTDHQYHLLNCVPPSQWPRDFRERKAAAMRHGDDDIMEIDGRPFNAGPIPREVVERPPEAEKPRGIAEYRRLHPEANPLTTEHITVREFRNRDDGGTDEWDRVVGVREAMNQAQPCPRCNRPMLDRSMHITCRAVDGSVPEPSLNRLKRDDVELHPRHPVIHTQDEVRTGPAWFEALPQAEDPPTDEDEMRDFIGEVSRETLEDRLIAEQEAWSPPLELAVHGDPNAPTTHIVTVTDVSAADYAKPEPFTCPTCGRVSKSAAGSAAHIRSHKDA